MMQHSVAKYSNAQVLKAGETLQTATEDCQQSHLLLDTWQIVGCCSSEGYKKNGQDSQGDLAHAATVPVARSILRCLLLLSLPLQILRRGQ